MGSLAEGEYVSEKFFKDTFAILFVLKEKIKIKQNKKKPFIFS